MCIERRRGIYSFKDLFHVLDCHRAQLGPDVLDNTTLGWAHYEGILSKWFLVFSSHEKLHFSNSVLFRPRVGPHNKGQHGRGSCSLFGCKIVICIDAKNICEVASVVVLWNILL